ncbi:TRM11 family SAM-dependent methyltransferase [Luteipulveratus halotolerans]|uniref:Ribosomal RNA large subunit methyltransferase K/L-like methyltransferase domain-containing protein n=1 Tax=Luteipulveratus halotolerans TaxID=1631356 RepID=A0A0L6CI94_9MICO|nr:hypothetical protein [Luteipulveratus halotolerans]KNX37511.1 hypothetical protein VV01_10685 [Luteipulveratus halotolerans]
MTAFLLLVAPSANRVYADAAPALMAAEARSLATAFIDGEVTVEATRIAGVDYLRVSADEIGPVGVRALSNLSAVHALFEAEGELLRPVAADRVDAYPSDLLTIQKYPGKTNEQLTRLLLNVTAAATSRPQRLLDGTLDVLDPMCGRGTTLNLALTYGLDVTGVDLDKRDLEAYETFLKTWLRQTRLKHTVRTSAIRTAGQHRGRRLDVEVAPSKEDFKAGRTQRLTYLGTDTTRLEGLVRSGAFDVVVTDTPYGVQHGSHGDRIARNPLELLDSALPGWVRALRTGGAVGLSYNRHVAPPHELADLLEQHGLTVVGDPADDTFRHRVDASIDRDVIVARKGSGRDVVG